MKHNTSSLLRSICLASALTLALTPALADQWRVEGHDNGHHNGQQQDHDNGRHNGQQQGHDNGWRGHDNDGHWHGQDGHQPNFAHPNYRWDHDHYTTIYHPTYIRELPPSHTTVVIRNRTYFVNDGVFYERHPEGWINVAAPLGWISATLPLGAVTLHIGTTPYFFADGIYYRHYTTGYVVVSAPAPVYSTPTSQITTEIGLLNVRSGPGLNFPITETVPGNTTLDVYGSTPGWYYIKLQDNSYGWVMSQYTSANGAAG